MIRILVVDDHLIVLEALRLRINAEPDMAVVAEATSGQDAVLRAEEHHPDIVLIDIGMPGMSCFDALRHIQAKVPGARSIVLTGLPEDRRIVEAIRAGASGFVTKDCGFDTVREAIQTVAAGGVHYPSEILSCGTADEVPVHPSEPARARLDKLTARERELLSVLAQGYHLKEAAHTLRISYKTADRHKASLMKKLDIHDRVELARFAIREKIIQP